ncbi:MULTISPECIES: heavy metal translocating P-type ATPase [Cupriavidus]|uniref:P-type Zn(2+) transporter n=2 Tax=Cupriavidus pinatubonensis TaxID=248026 RepID=Q472S8_CUPPJ|nr:MULTISPECIES: heavy metal translocating P-type ATPase [Cupriavidus]QYY32803.1 heavy metal translocating P-type ATPase [Cupriavidus pinatubonensis]
MRLPAGRLNGVLLAVSAVTLAGGLVARQLQGETAAEWIWIAGTLPNAMALAISSARAAIRRQSGIDALALLSIVVALIFGEFLVAAVVSLMLATGRALEDYAQSRARREMTALLSHAPRRANRLEGGQWQQVDVAEVRPGDRLMVRHAEVVPVDGALTMPAELDESALTGESAIRKCVAGESVKSGALNAGAALEMMAGATEAESTFASIVRMVAAAQAERSPSVRLADRYAVQFTGLTLLLAGASWLWSGEPMRILAILVVATPCPLILAVPVAIVSGMSRCAKRGVLVKGGGALEGLAKADTLFFDKTGTLTGGVARLVGIECTQGYLAETVLSLAASLAQASNHVISDAVAMTARERGLELLTPSDVRESPGAGVQGIVGGQLVRIGSLTYAVDSGDAAEWAKDVIRRVRIGGISAVFVSLDGHLAGVIQLADSIRLETPRALRLLRKEGVTRQAMLTGDRVDIAEAVGAMLGVSEIHAEQSPADKLATIHAARRKGTVIMVGDGVNDAPALAAADIGVAMGVRGAAASSEAADVVLLVDRLDRLVDAVQIARRTRRIAMLSVEMGMMLSFAAMLAAGLGFLPPLPGAILQEGIDVLAIVNALRALRADAREPGGSLGEADVARLKAEHTALEPIMDRIRAVADMLPRMDGRAAQAELKALNCSLTEVLVPHERSDDISLYPDVARMLGGEDPMAAMSAMHREIFRVATVLGRTIAQLPPEGPDPRTVQDLQRLLYGLDAILRLHCAQEDELFHVLGKGC